MCTFWEVLAPFCTRTWFAYFLGGFSIIYGHKICHFVWGHIASIMATKYVILYGVSHILSKEANSLASHIASFLATKYVISCGVSHILSNKEGNSFLSHSINFGHIFGEICPFTRGYWAGSWPAASQNSTLVFSRASTQ